jgi:hypothetical protein
MESFLKQFGRFSLPLLVLLLMGNIILGVSPKRYSNSISFNAKMLDIKVQHLEKKPYLISIGSSMSLNNISSSSFRDKIDSNFVNISSWGQSIEFTYLSLRYFDKLYNPKLVVFPSNIGDFHKTRNQVPSFESSFFTKSLFNPFDFEWNFLSRQSRRFHYYKRNNCSYKFLGFDGNGGVSLGNKDFVINPERWLPDTIYSPDTGQYSYLDSIFNLSIKSGFKIIIVQTPLRRSYLNTLTESENQLISEHLVKIKMSCEKSDVQFINGLNFVLDDSLYVDYSHLNNIGSGIFSDSVINLIKRR